MRGFDLNELPDGTQDKLWQRGGFPRSYLAADDESSVAWRKNFIRTFLERDLAALGFGLSPALMGRFWTMLAHYHAQLWNGSEIAASLGVAPNTARAYLDALEQTYMIRRLLPRNTSHHELTTSHQTDGEYAVFIWRLVDSLENRPRRKPSAHPRNR